MSHCRASHLQEKKNSTPLIPCACQKPILQQASASAAKVNKVRYFGIALAALALWWAMYSAILPLSQWLAYDLFSLGRDTMTGNAVEFFFYDISKILLLLLLMVYVIGWLRAGMHMEKVRNYLAGKGRGIGYFLARAWGPSLLSVPAPASPCSWVSPQPGIPLGITMSFLITSPLINEIAVVLLWGLLGWKFTVIYVLVGVLAGVVGGIITDALMRSAGCSLIC